MGFTSVNLHSGSHGFMMTSLLLAAISHASFAFLVSCTLDYLPCHPFPNLPDDPAKMLLPPIPNIDATSSVPVNGKPRFNKAKSSGLSGVELVTIFYALVLAVLCLVKRLSPEECLSWGYSYLIALVRR